MLSIHVLLSFCVELVSLTVSSVFMCVQVFLVSCTFL